jgi:hypothetical protein
MAATDRRATDVLQRFCRRVNCEITTLSLISQVRDLALSEAGGRAWKGGPRRTS